jgi:hypothetical protein
MRTTASATGRHRVSAQSAGWIRAADCPDPSAVVSITAPFGGPDQFYVLEPSTSPWLPYVSYHAEKGPEYLVVEHTVAITDGAVSAVELVMSGGPTWRRRGG